MDLTEIVAVQAEGNYVSLRHRPNPYLLRESLSSTAEKLKPYGFLRIHRLVVVNISAVEHPTFADGRVLAACKRWEGILGNADIQRQPQRSGSKGGRLRAPSRLTGRQSYYLVIVVADNNSIALSAPNTASAMLRVLIAENGETPTSMHIHTIVNH